MVNELSKFTLNTSRTVLTIKILSSFFAPNWCSNNIWQ